MKSYLLITVLFIGFLSCSKQTGKKQTTEIASDTVKLSYAERFRILRIGNHRLVEVKNPFPGSTDTYKYLLVRKGEPLPAIDPETTLISVPVERIVCTSTTHIPLLDYLDESNALVGFPTTDYISSEKMRKRIDEGLITELGIDKGLNMERLATLKPDFVMAYSLTGELGQFKKMEELGIPVIMNAEYLEKHPLGRAEWIKFMALFFNKEEMADSIFQQIELAYTGTQLLVENVPDKPTVMSGIVYGDTWFLPGGRNYAAQLFKDAGCSYLWSDTESNGFLELSFESVFEKAHHADLWIGVASFQSLHEIEEVDKRYAHFDSFKNGNVYTYDYRKGAKGGSEYLELGYLRPDLILNDLVKIAHPELLPDEELYFHKKLQ